MIIMVIIIACVHTKLEFKIFEIFIEHFSVVSPLHWGTNFWYFRRLLNNNYYHKNIFKKIKYLFETRKEGNIYVCVNLREVWGYKCKKRSASTAPGRRCCPWARTAVDDHVSRARDRTAEILHSVTNWARVSVGLGQCKSGRIAIYDVGPLMTWQMSELHPTVIFWTLSLSFL